MGQSGSASQKTAFFAFKSSVCRHPVEILSSRRTLTRCPPRKCSTDLCALDISNCQSCLQSRFQQYNAKSHFFASLARVPRDRSLISVSASDTKDFHVVEKEALLLFKGSISKDPRGVLSSWTLSGYSSSPCTGGWRGIGCDSTGRIVSLDLDACNLTGQINPSLSNLTFLSPLNLSINSFSGPIPPQLGRLSFLSSLDFKWNALIDNIPPELGNCTSLVWLDLSHNQLNGTLPPSLGQLSYLYMLQLHDLPSLTGPIPHQLGNLTNLTYLYLGSNSLTGSIPPEFGNLYMLKELYLMLNHLNEYAYGGKLTAKGDVYSYGIVLLEMLTRKRPTDDAFTGTSMTLWVQSTFRMNWISTNKRCPGDIAACERTKASQEIVG
ncbi:hypothetical protein KP509_28G064300 [Ceratopteris richardii]|uniref:Leucine-rich repeat-containing N-terminal plant-type domain-containing protein n=1 Tax=Ceratopteris richardii TaxID=49495 RepID=A0A8T2RFC5_CERRI|nr:hypothetical protein KP509_28G064300 [Ceratopteris richardii]